MSKYSRHTLAACLRFMKRPNHIRHVLFLSNASSLTLLCRSGRSADVELTRL
jgi:hypothetical protein